MKRDTFPQISVSPWAVLSASLLLYFSPLKSVRPLLLPVLSHELGHWLALRLLGCRIRSVRVEITGLCMRYTGATKPRQTALTAMAGPLAGFLYAGAVYRLGPNAQLSAGISLLLSLFNLIPAPPLDGAQIAQQLFGSVTAERLGRCCAVAVSAVGACAFAADRGPALALTGLLLLFRLAADQSSSSAILPEAIT